MLFGLVLLCIVVFFFGAFFRWLIRNTEYYKGKTIIVRASKWQGTRNCSPPRGAPFCVCVCVCAALHGDRIMPQQCEASCAQRHLDPRRKEHALLNALCLVLAFIRKFSVRFARKLKLKLDFQDLPTVALFVRIQLQLSREPHRNFSNKYYSQA